MVWRTEGKIPMATNPFEDEDGRYFALINDEGQHSLWPTFVDVPEGWRVVHGEDSRKACLDYIEENWTDMRPNSLIAEISKYEKKNGAKSKSAAKSRASATKVHAAAIDGDGAGSHGVAAQNGS
jgi:MbtH protein